MVLFQSGSHRPSRSNCPVFARPLDRSPHLRVAYVYDEEKKERGSLLMEPENIPEFAFAIIEAAAALEGAGLADPTKYERQNTVDRAKKYMRAGWESWPEALREAAEQQGGDAQRAAGPSLRRTRPAAEAATQRSLVASRVALPVRQPRGPRRSESSLRPAGGAALALVVLTSGFRSKSK
jgi:hypothetical protein